MQTEKDKSILNHIVQHCENIFSTIERFGDYTVFEKDTDYFNSICMSLLQIGELANHLSDEFKNTNTKIAWRSIIGLRHVIVHGYGQLNTDVVWETLQEDVKKLYQYCRHRCEN